MATPRLIGTHHHVANSIIGGESSGEDAGSGFAGVIQNFINDSGGDLELGDVVVLKTAGDRFIDLTTSLADVNVQGVVAASGPFADGDETPVLVAGYHAFVKVTGAVARGDYLQTDTAPGTASVAADPAAGTFARVVSDDAAGFAACVVFDRLLSVSSVVAFLDLSDVPATYAGASEKGVAVNVGETGLEFVDLVKNFVDLGDVPSAYTGFANKAVSVKGDESGLEFTAFPSGKVQVVISIASASVGGHSYSP